MHHFIFVVSNVDAQLLHVNLDKKTPKTKQQSTQNCVMVDTSPLDCLPQVPSGMSVFFFSPTFPFLLSVKVTEILLKKDAKHIYFCFHLCNCTQLSTA